MLDGIAATVKRAMQPNASVGVASYFLSPAMSLVDNRFEFFQRECRLRNQFAILAHPGTMRHVNLDPVGSVVQLLARSFAGFDRPVDELRALGHVQLGSVTFQHVTTGRGDSAGYNEQARAGNVAFFNRFFDSDVAISRPFGFQIAQCGEALLQGAPSRDSGPDRAQRQRRIENIGVVTALGGIFPLQKNVRVRIDKPGQDGSV